MAQCHGRSKPALVGSFAKLVCVSVKDACVRRTCDGCDDESESKESSNFLSVEIEKGVTLDGWAQRKEEFAEYRRETGKCTCKTSTLRLSQSLVPDVLFVQLKRFAYGGGQPSKIDREVCCLLSCIERVSQVCKRSLLSWPPSC